jgi:hypothetical protein
LGRIIKLETAGKERNHLTRVVVLAIRELMQQSQPNLETKDLASFIAIALNRIYETIDLSVAAWEKRGYWLKADRFRLDWAWTGQLSQQMKEAVLSDNWAEVAAIAVKVGGKLNHIRVSQRNRLGKPWVGSWEKLRDST